MANAEATIRLGDNVTPFPVPVLAEAAEADEYDEEALLRQAASLLGQAEQAEAAEVAAGERAEELREERALLFKHCEQLFGTLIRFSGLSRPKAASSKAALSVTVAPPVAFARAIGGDNDCEMAQSAADRVARARQARDQARRSLESAQRALKEMEDYVEWVRGDVELLRQECQNRATNLTMYVGASEILPERQERGRNARILDLEAGLMSPPSVEWLVRTGAAEVVSIGPPREDDDSDGQANDAFDDMCGAKSKRGLPCELRAVAPGTTAVTVHKRRVARGGNSDHWPLPEDAWLITVEEAANFEATRASRDTLYDEGFLNRTPSRCVTIPLDGFFGKSCNFDEGVAIALDGHSTNSLNFGGDFASSFVAQGQFLEAATTTPFHGTTTPPFLFEAELTEHIWPGEVAIPFEATKTDYMWSEFPQTPAWRPDADPTNSNVTPREVPITPEANWWSQLEDRPPSVAAILDGGELRGGVNEDEVDPDADVEGLAQVCAQFRCADARGRGMIGRADLARLLKALDAGEWTDARVNRLLGAAHTTGGLSRTASENGNSVDGNSPAAPLLGTDGEPISYEEFLGWLFGPTPRGVEAAARLTARVQEMLEVAAPDPATAA